MISCCTGMNLKCPFSHGSRNMEWIINDLVLHHLILLEANRSHFAVPCLQVRLADVS